jgi:hypothetical protein
VRIVMGMQSSSDTDAQIPIEGFYSDGLYATEYATVDLTGATVHRDERNEEDRPSFGGERLHHATTGEWVVEMIPEMDIYSRSYWLVTDAEAHEWLVEHGHNVAR